MAESDVCIRNADKSGARYDGSLLLSLWMLLLARGVKRRDKMHAEIKQDTSSESRDRKPYQTLDNGRRRTRVQSDDVWDVFNDI